MKPEETFETNGLTVSIYRDEVMHQETPDDWDEACKLVTTDNRYFVVHPQIDGSRLTAEDLRDDDRRAEVEQGWHVFPLYAYIHSKVALSMGTGGQFSCPWDSGQIGFVLASKDPNQSGQDDDNPRTQAEARVETWNQYLSGDVWGYTIERDGEHVDSCWGFYGLDYCMDEAKAAAEYLSETETNESIACAACMAL